MAFSDFTLSAFPRLMNVVARLRSSFWWWLLLSFILSLSHCIHPFVVGRTLPLSGFVNDTANTYAHIVVGIYVFISFKYMPRSGPTGSYANSMLNSWRNCQTAFLKWLDYLHSLQVLYESSNVSAFWPILTIFSIRTTGRYSSLRFWFAFSND